MHSVLRHADRPNIEVVTNTVERKCRLILDGLESKGLIGKKALVEST